MRKGKNGHVFKAAPKESEAKNESSPCQVNNKAEFLMKGCSVS